MKNQKEKLRKLSYSLQQQKDKIFSYKFRLPGWAGRAWEGFVGEPLVPPPAEEMDEDGLPLMGSGIDLTKVCKDGVGFRQPGRRMGKGRWVPRKTPPLCPALVYACLPPLLGGRVPQFTLKRGPFRAF